MSLLYYSVEDCSKHLNSGMAGMQCILWQNDMHTGIIFARGIKVPFT